MPLEWIEIGDKCGTGAYIITIAAGNSLELKGDGVDEEWETPIGKTRTYSIRIVASESNA